MDATELLRENTRQALEAQHGQVWNIEELNRDFVVIGYDAPYVIVRRRIDNVLGSLLLHENPRLYYLFDCHDQRG